jgi:hypothetical protein
MNDRTFSGVGTSFVVHDACATESMGPIQDRSQEQLGATDKAIVMARLLLLRAIREVESGREAPHVVRDPGANRFPLLGAVDMAIPRSADWRTVWKPALAGEAVGGIRPGVGR